MKKILAVASLTLAGLLPLSAQAGEVYGGLDIMAHNSVTPTP